MKKTIGIILLLVIIGFIGYTVVNMVSDKTPVTASDFYTTMSEKGYTLVDATSQYAEYDYVTQVYLAVNKDYTYQIEFFELASDEYAMNFYTTNKDSFETEKSGTSANTSIAVANYAKYTLSSNGKYQVVSVIDNTGIYVDVDDMYKDEVQSVLSELGY